MSFLTPFLEVYNYTLQPIAPFTWFGLSISTLDLASTARLCLVLRQIREISRNQHEKHGSKPPAEPYSFVKHIFATLLVVYGGEAITAPYLGIPPSFMISGVVPVLYITVQALVEILPAVPVPSLYAEVPLSIWDGFSRAMLLCSLIPPVVTAHSSPIISSSAWCLLLTSLISANAGFFLVNLFSFLNPTPLTLQTPPELQPYGWTTVDIWCAPLITGLYAFMTHAQPFWADAHSFAIELLGGSLDHDFLKPPGNGKEIEAVDPEVARALCATILSVLFVSRTVKNFSANWKVGLSGPGKKVFHSGGVNSVKKGSKINPKTKTQ